VIWILICNSNYNFDSNQNFAWTPRWFYLWIGIFVSRKFFVKVTSSMLMPSISSMGCIIGCYHFQSRQNQNHSILSNLKIYNDLVKSFQTFMWWYFSSLEDTHIRANYNALSFNVLSFGGFPCSLFCLRISAWLNFFFYQGKEIKIRAWLYFSPPDGTTWFLYQVHT